MKDERVDTRNARLRKMIETRRSHGNRKRVFDRISIGGI